MEENRRGFLKTLGKLGVALGITTAACSAHHHGHHDPHPKHPKPLTDKELQWVKDGKKVMEFEVPDDGFHLASEAKIHTADKAELDTFGRTTSALKPGDPIKIRDTGKVNTDGLAIRETYKTSTISPGSTILTSASHPVSIKNKLLQEDMNEFYNTVIDSKRMETMPPMFIPAHIRDFVMQKEAIRSLDPYNWGAVFALKWYDWDTRDPRHATVVGRWEATVKPQFVGVFDFECYYQSKAIAMEYLASRVTNVEAVKKHAKRDCYLTLVETLQDKILERIKQDVKNQPIMTNVCLTSPRDAAVLDGITD